MKLKFMQGDEKVLLDIDRKHHKLKGASSKTNYQTVDKQWHDLFDKGKEVLQDRATRPLSDELFKRLIVYHMAKLGYTFEKEYE